VPFRYRRQRHRWRSPTLNRPPYTLSLDTPDLSLAVAGGKGANLSRLRRAGLPVPAGFVVTTLAYRDFVESSGIQDDIIQLSRVQTDDPAAVEQASLTIRALFDGSAPPAPIEAAVRQALL